MRGIGDPSAGHAHKINGKCVNIIVAVPGLVPGRFNGKGDAIAKGPVTVGGRYLELNRNGIPEHCRVRYASLDGK